MKRYLLFGFSIITYLFSMIVLSFMILWVYPWSFFPYYIDAGVQSSFLSSITVDIGLLLLFGLQHSLMAREFFKEKILAKFSPVFKSSLYGISSAICLALLMHFWQPVNGTVWSFEGGILFWSMSALYLFGWSFAFVSSFLIDHFELFGLHQGYRAFKNLPEPHNGFQTKLFYKFVRHPIQLGTLVGLWATPSMSSGHLLLSVGLSIYVVIGLHLEERSLVKEFGEKYRKYQQNVPLLIPFIK